ncbi:HAMP domain-containing protein [Thermodesulfobacteriota bacterium]
MIIICEECGKKYRIDPAKIKGKAASFKCRDCTHLIVVSKPEPPPEMAAMDSRPTLESITTTIDDSSMAAKNDIRQAPEKARHRTKGLGLRSKMLLLFMVVPIILMAGASLLYLWQLESTSNLLTRESSKFVNQMAEEKIADISAAVAMQCKLYLLSHPGLIREDFNEDMGFKTLAVQKVGMTGYTALYELPGPDGVWRTWAHVNNKIIGIDMSKLKKPLGRNFPGFWKIYIGVEGGKKSQGYYTWQDKDGKFRDKFMVCIPVAGTRFVVAATTYMDEFTGPVKRMQARANELTEKARLITWAILGLTLLLIGLIVTIYGHRLTGKIKSLTDVADRISVGELGMEIKTTSKDEIGELAEAIARMQDSIRLSIERLRRRR